MCVAENREGVDAFVIAKDRMKEVVQSEQELILYFEIRHGPVLF